MAANYLQDGTVIDYANAGAAIASGDVVIVGNRIGVALVDIAATTGTGAVSFYGVYELPAVNGAAFVQGETVLWDDSASMFDDSAAVAAAGDVSLGATAFETKTAGASDTVKIALSGAVGTVT